MGDGRVYVATHNGSVYALNANFPGRLAAVCHERNTYLVHISTDYVFDGAQGARAYREEDVPNPLSWYGQTKLAGERLVQEAHPGACVARIEMPFSGRAHARSDFARTCLRRRLPPGAPIRGRTTRWITSVPASPVSSPAPIGDRTRPG